MEELRFKTNLKCNGCVNIISKGFEKIHEILVFKVNLDSPDKVLEITATADVTNRVIESVKKAGYEISRL
jgi:copper chaperone